MELLEVKIYKSILEVYFIFRLLRYILSMTQFLQDKILVEVYIIYGTMACWVGHMYCPNL